MIFGMDIRFHFFHNLQKMIYYRFITTQINTKLFIIQLLNIFETKNGNSSAAPHLRAISPPHIAILEIRWPAYPNMEHI